MHMQSYLSEYVFRYNKQDEGRAMFLTLLLRAADPERIRVLPVGQACSSGVHGCTLPTLL